MNSFQNAIVYRQEEQHYKRVLRAQAVLEIAYEKMCCEHSYSVIVELEDTSDSFYNLLNSMEVTNGLFVVTRIWFGLSKRKVRVTSTSCASLDFNVKFPHSKRNVVDNIFKY